MTETNARVWGRSVLGFALLSGVSAVLFMLATTWGSAWIFRQAVLRALQAESVEAASFKGRLAGTFEVDDFKAVRSGRLGGADLMSKNVRVRLRFLGLGGIRVEAEGVLADLSNQSLLERGFGRFRANRLVLNPAEARAEDLIWEGSGWLPADYRVRIQTLTVRDPWTAPRLAALGNGRLQAKDTTVLLVTAEEGTSHRTVAEASTPSLRLADLFSTWPLPPKARGADATLRDVGLHAAGSGDTWTVEGEAVLTELAIRGMLVKDARLRLDQLMLSRIDGAWQILGRVVLEGGQMSRGSTRLELETGSMLFRGEGTSPRVALKAVSHINRTVINLLLSGTLDEPLVKVSSTPPLPEERLYFMLFTGKGWKGLESSVEGGRVNARLAGDMADYLLFGGRGERIARRLGIKDWSVASDAQKTTASVTKAVTDSVDVTYGMEVPKDSAVAPASVAGVDFKVAEDTVVSLEGKKSTGRSTDGGTTKAAPPESGVNLALKKNF